MTWYKAKSKWLAQIMLHGKNHYLGRFDDEIEAAEAYDRAALSMFGEFARINFPLAGHTRLCRSEEDS